MRKTYRTVLFASSHTALSCISNKNCDPIWQDLNGKTTITTRQFNKNKRTILIVLQGADCGTVCDKASKNSVNQWQPAHCLIIPQKCPKLPKEWSGKKAARSFDSFGQLETQISYTYLSKCTRLVYLLAERPLFTRKVWQSIIRALIIHEFSKIYLFEYCEVAC